MFEERLLKKIITLHYLFFRSLCEFVGDCFGPRYFSEGAVQNNHLWIHTMTSEKMVCSYYCLKGPSMNRICLLSDCNNYIIITLINTDQNITRSKQNPVLIVSKLQKFIMNTCRKSKQVREVNLGVGFYKSLWLPSWTRFRLVQC